jgi:hypothetical protein
MTIGLMYNDTHPPILDSESKGMISSEFGGMIDDDFCHGFDGG